MLDEELTRLPGKYRLPLILCCLEGKARDEVAHGLGVPLAAVKSRLEEGRELLRRRLAGRGVQLSAALAAFTLPCESAHALVPASYVSATSRAAMEALVAPITTNVVSASVLALVKGGSRTMLTSKLKIVTAALVVLAVVAVWTTGQLYQTLAAEPPRTEKPAAREVAKAHTESKPIVVKEGNQLIRLAWSADGTTVATIGVRFEANETKEYLTAHSTIKLWDAKTGELKKSLGEEPKTYMIAIAISPDKKTAAYQAHTHSDDPTKPAKPEVRIVDAETWAVKRRVEVEGSVMALAFSPDGKTLAFAGGGAAADRGFFVQLWDVQNEKIKGGTEFDDKFKVRYDPLTQRDPSNPPARPPDASALCLAFSRDGKVLAAGDREGKIRLFDGRTGEPRQKLEHGQGPVTSIAFADDKRLVSAGALRLSDPNAAPLPDAGVVKFWDLETGKLLRKLDTQCSAWLVAVSGGRLVTAGLRKEGDKLIPEYFLWDAKTGELRHTLPESSVGAYAMAISPDGKTLATAGGTDADLKTNEGKTTGELRLIPLE